MISEDEEDVSECQKNIYRKMERGFSRAIDNELLVIEARNIVENEFQTLEFGFVETPSYTFALPDLLVYEKNYREFLERDLIDVSSLEALENCGALNWWNSQSSTKLWPLVTSGDGNCLLHAASLGMWGFHDRLLTLRRALHVLLSCNTEVSSALKRRWRHESHLQNLKIGLVLSEEEWSKEWKTIIALSSSTPRQNESLSRRSRMIDGKDFGTFYESLEDIHVYALTHVLRRPIIVVSDSVLLDSKGEPLSPITFGGLYLPLELSSDQCHKSPLILAYNHGHFTPLVTMRQKESLESKALFPIMNVSLQLLPIHFIVDPLSQTYKSDKITNSFKVKLLSKYLECVSIPKSLSKSQFPSSSFGKTMSEKLKKNISKLSSGGNGRLSVKKDKDTSVMMAALIHDHDNLPVHDQMIENYLQEARERFEISLNPKRSSLNSENKNIVPKRSETLIVGNSRFYIPSSSSHQMAAALT